MIAFTVATSSLGFDFATPFLPLYVRELGAQDLSTTALWSGLVIGAGPLTAALVAPLWGIAADRFGRRPVVILSLAAFGMLQLAFAFATTIVHLLLIRIAIGLFGGLVNSAMALAVIDCPPEKIGQVIGRLQAAQFIPLAIGPVIGGVLADRFGLRTNFVLAAFLSLVACLVISMLYHSVETRVRDTDAPTPVTTSSATSLWSLFRMPAILVVMTVLFVGQFVDRSFSPILPIYVAVLDAPAAMLASTAGLIISAGALATAISANLSGHLSTRFETRALLVIALVSGALLTLSISIVNSVWQLFVLRIFLGLLAGGAITLAYTFGARHVAQRNLATVFGIFGSSTMLGSGVSFLSSGLVGYVSLPGVFLVDALLYLCCLTIVAAYWKHLAELTCSRRTGVTG